MRRLLLSVVLAATLFCGGCVPLGYYWQSVGGQMQILQGRQSITSVIDDPATPPELKAKLTRMLAIRDFASRELKLPDNLSYRGYVNVRREYVVWNVFVADEFSVEPRHWCFPIIGCVDYRGYFAVADAEAFARQERALGRDVFVGGVPAYSTLGWFDDPVLNTFIHYPEQELARLIFHELAHQIVYVKNDTEFNESFAVAVELEGVRRWIAVHGDEKMHADFERARERRAQFVELVFKYRDELATLYRSRLAAEAMRERKAEALDAMKKDYEQLRAQGGWSANADRFFAGVNNAGLASVAIYHKLVPQFQQLVAKHDGDLAAFYGAVKKLAQLGEQERRRVLAGGP